MTADRDEFRDKPKNELVREIIELRAENTHRTEVHRAIARSRTVQTLGKWGFGAIMVVALSVALTEWAGTATVLSADVEVSANVSADAEITLPQIAKIERQYQKIVGLFALISVFGVSYGIGQRRLRQNAIAELHPYQKQYELEHDPRRSSSTLDKVGNTNPGDR